MNLNAIALFIEVAKKESFTQAARALGVSKSHLSSTISELEKSLGVSLLTRTTRKVTLTEAGDRYYRKCIAAFADLSAAQEEVTQSQGKPQGLLRVTAPAAFSETLFTDAIVEVLRAFPDVRIEAVFTDRRVDLIGENFDLALRAGHLKDSTLIAKKVAYSKFILVAGAKYVRGNQPINEVRDLAEHPCLLFGDADEETWTLHAQTSRQSVRATGRFKANSLRAIKQLALLNQGVALLPSLTCEPELSQGKLVRILPQYQSETHPIHLVYSAQRYVTPKLKAALPYFEKVLQKMHGHH